MSITNDSTTEPTRVKMMGQVSKPIKGQIHESISGPISGSISGPIRGPIDESTELQDPIKLLKLKKIYLPYMMDHITQLLENRIVKKKDILYIIKCINNESFLPRCLNDPENILSPYEMKRLSILVLHKLLIKPNSDENYLL